jgi:hypothetical protein
MSRYGSFDYDKSEQLINIGRNKARKALAALPKQDTEQTE